MKEVYRRKILLTLLEKTDEEMEDMIEYLKRYQKIMTDHQAIQHANKVLYRFNSNNKKSDKM